MPVAAWHHSPSQPGEAAGARAVLEQLLAAAGLNDDGACAARLIAEFGSLPLLFAASPGQQLRAAGDRRVVALLQAAKRTLRAATRADLDRRPILVNSRALRDYLMVHLADEPNEQVRILYLNAHDRLIVDELHSRGTPSTTPFCTRTIAARALEVGATSVVVAHNHPSGILESSRADIAHTAALEAALDTLGITLIDHLIVARGGLASVRAATRRMAA